VEKTLIAATLVLLGACAVLSAGCSRGGEGHTDPAPAVSVAPVVESTGVCAQRRQCCVALTRAPGFETARQLCKMHQMEDALGGQLTRDAGSYDDVCEKELHQLQSIWRLHTLASNGEMPTACLWPPETANSAPPAPAP
jgi:hypothetical protein